MKFVLVRVFGIAFFVLMTAFMFRAGLIREAMQPFTPLPEHIRLISHLNYVALLVTPILSVGVIALGLYQLFHPKRDVHSYGTYGKYFTVVLFLGLSVAFVNRMYLGYRVDQAGYVKCAEESRTSAKSSWRVYAKDLSLCKSSSGIAGG
ncbi:DUF1240 domain-containing protein [Salinivibrio kushneri]|uniref:Uncharacterized protein n=1 Tax=Salinivibrio kushneri TaxID=1908198 RepID=A0AB36K4V4_9GAMM|nr:DUF1240 domain-containing protein [Salinivibrio kushneri]OOE42362.1 hypothetical protein BZG09_13885 [Salinivibrio kushneri]OOE52411.1 hypothetical protein BZG12_10865 [Salinivibrio kushneri]